MENNKEEKEISLDLDAVLGAFAEKNGMQGHSFGLKKKLSDELGVTPESLKKQEKAAPKSILTAVKLIELTGLEFNQIYK